MKARQIVKDLWEAAYADNIGFEEMVRFYRKASQKQIEKMERLCKENDWDGFKRLIKLVLSIDLKD
jgi:hypothetical protein